MSVHQNAKPKRKQEGNVFYTDERWNRRWYTNITIFMIIIAIIRVLINSQPERLLNTIIGVFILWSLCIGLLYLVTSRTKLTIQKDGIVYQDFLTKVFVSWKSVERLGLYISTSRWVMYLSQPSVCIYARLFLGKANYLLYKDKLFLSPFADENLPQSELGQAIAHYAPHLFEESDDPKLKNALMLEDDYDEQITDFSTDEREDMDYHR